jgi:single-strand DNA-binding protein
MAKKVKRKNDFNSVQMTGTLARDPDLKYTPTGKAVCEFTVALKEYFKAKEKTNYILCVAWNKLAEEIGTMKAGDRIQIGNGMLKQDSWEDGEGKRRYKTYVLVFHLGAGSRAPKDDGDGNDPFEPDGIPF